MKSPGGILQKKIEKEAIKQAFLLYVCDSIKTVREIKGYSQVELSKKAGVDRSHLHEIEKEGVNMKVGTLWDISDALGIHIQNFVDYE